MSDDPKDDDAPSIDTFLQKLPIRYPWHDRPVHATLLTKPTATRICEALRAGHSHATAAKLAGLNPTTLSQWLSKGDTDDDTEQTRPYIAFRCAVLLAESEAEDTSIRSVRNAGAKDWKAHAWWLSRRHHQAWAERSREGESGRNGITLNVGIALPGTAHSPQLVGATIDSVPALPPAQQEPRVTITGIIGPSPELSPPPATGEDEPS